MCIRDSSYTIDSGKKSDEGSYKVVVTNTKNDVTATATSNVCAVTVESIVVTPPATPVFTTNRGTAPGSYTHLDVYKRQMSVIEEAPQNRHPSQT